MRSMYSEVKLFIRHLGTLANFFCSHVGLLQGEITSPILFSIFLNDIELYMQTNLDCGITLEQLNTYMILFADDAVLLSETAPPLVYQNLLTF